MIYPTDASWSWNTRQPESQLESQPECQQELCDWLQDTGSLTERLRQCCQHFRVQLQRTRAQVSLTVDQAAWLGVDRAYCREVLLLCDNQPWVYASSLYSPAALKAVPALGGLGERALGELLFEHPKLTRSDFEFAQLTRNQWQQLLQEQAELGPASLFSNIPTNTQASASDALPWARRSLLAIPQAGVLVTELFLPAAQRYRESNRELNREHR